MKLHRRQLLKHLALAASCALWMAPAGATVLANWSLEDLAKRADLVVIAKVTEQAYVVDEERRAVLTESTVEVERTLMGKTLPGFTLTQLGGRAGSVVTEVMGDARLNVGDRVLLFTFEHDDKRRYLVGMALGVWHLEATDDAPILSQQIDEPLVEMTGTLLPAPGRRTTSLDDVKAAIDAVAASGNKATSKRLD